MLLRNQDGTTGSTVPLPTAPMSKPRPKKEREPKDAEQLPLPGPQAKVSSTTRVLPMQIRVGDRLTDETGEWEIIGPPYDANGEKCPRACQASR